MKDGGTCEIDIEQVGVPSYPIRMRANSGRGFGPAAAPKQGVPKEGV
jgi:hypothetical protein